MTIKTETVRARIDPNLKHEGESVLSAIGLNTSDAITMFFHQIVMRQGLPFDARIPNKKTIASINEPHDKMNSFDNVDTLFDDLNN